ncbi:hypothetical protein A5724_26170 [Mycobacterium sp. ACS1612]|uniref:hypothetical protein n=1 Tax=Mycobacterium sp. ACS1612 TaxID=1834117 RepID=UPI0008009B5F|nr:hypothetical protein [Mycobacterium sp. ACS1612]OBF28907.1 hypothetical protein A5724_26170 [Mycobacterium sp. ACS1612]
MPGNLPVAARVIASATGSALRSALDRNPNVVTVHTQSRISLTLNASWYFLEDEADHRPSINSGFVQGPLGE